MEVAPLQGRAVDAPSSNAGTAARTMMVIDDDDLSRELLAMIAADAGFEVQSCSSGDEALTVLDSGLGVDVILTDMQMPGITGDELARRLRQLCGAKTRVLAMSGSKVRPQQIELFDGFLLKPFSAGELKAACDQTTLDSAPATMPPDAILNESVYANFAAGMPPAQVAALYQMCIDDARRRLEKMRSAIEERDDGEFRRCAHAIKGSCGMVGANEMAKLAAAMEAAGLPAEHDVTPLDRFLAASERLERMLNIKVNGLDPGSPVVRD